MMDNPAAWWVLAGLFVAMELFTGTFYLLMLALGAAAAAVAAHLGLAPTLHWAVFALVGGVAVVVLYAARRRWGRRTADDLRHDHLDLGATVEVTAWSADGTTRVSYRGSDWSARPARRGPLYLGPHRIAGQDGNVLLVEPLSTAGAVPCPVPPGQQAA